ncbi:hypothetical protein CHS0354_038026, partial [Potamilus streckersoni]
MTARTRLIECVEYDSPYKVDNTVWSMTARARLIDCVEYDGLQKVDRLNERMTIP